jgi:hypothetical protein
MPTRSTTRASATSHRPRSCAGARNDTTEVHLSFTGADNKLGSVAAAPVELLSQRWSHLHAGIGRAGCHRAKGCGAVGSLQIISRPFPTLVARCLKTSSKDIACQAAALLAVFGGVAALVLVLLFLS